jgi:hypothetical protein
MIPDMAKPQPPKCTGFDVDEAKRLESLGITRKRISIDLGISRWTLWRALGPKTAKKGRAA